MLGVQQKFAQRFVLSAVQRTIQVAGRGLFLISLALMVVTILRKHNAAVDGFLSQNRGSGVEEEQLGLTNQLGERLRQRRRGQWTGGDERCGDVWGACVCSPQIRRMRGSASSRCVTRRAKASRSTASAWPAGTAVSRAMAINWQSSNDNSAFSSPLAVVSPCEPRLLLHDFGAIRVVMRRRAGLGLNIVQINFKTPFCQLKRRFGPGKTCANNGKAFSHRRPSLRPGGLRLLRAAWIATAHRLRLGRDNE